MSDLVWEKPLRLWIIFGHGSCVLVSPLFMVELSSNSPMTEQNRTRPSYACSVLGSGPNISKSGILFLSASTNSMAFSAPSKSPHRAKAADRENAERAHASAWDSLLSKRVIASLNRVLYPNKLGFKLSF